MSSKKRRKDNIVTGGLQILCCQEIAVAYYSLTLDALTLKPTGFCNAGVKLGLLAVP